MDQKKNAFRIVVDDDYVTS